MTVSNSREARTKYNTAGTSYKYRLADPEITDLPDGRQVVRVRNAGFFVTEEPANYPVRVHKHQCVGTYIRSAGGNTQTGSGYCDNVDWDGDVYWHYWTGSGDPGVPGSLQGTWTITGGTGKFKGIKGAGSWKNTGKTWPDGTWTERFEGIVELP